MRLGCLGVLGAEPVHESHQPLNFLLLVLVGRHQLRLVGLALYQEPLVIPRVPCDTTALQLDNVPYDLVEELAVVRYQQDCAGIVLQVALQPDERVQVEMVRWLVQHQQVWLLHEQASEVRPHDPSAAQLLGQAIEVTFLEAKPAQDLPRFRN